MPTPTRCPCLSGETYDDCCGRFHARAGEAGPYAPTAEALMRSRYSAFAVGDGDYLLATWHASTRPGTLSVDGDVEWQRLDILRTERGGPFDTDGEVEFRAHYRDAGGRGALHEVSRFVRERGRWFYVDGDVG